jgi:adenine deaminase
LSGRGSQPYALTEEERSRLRRVALGKESADLFLRGGTVVNVYSGELLEANVAVTGDRIAYVGAEERGVGSETEVIEAEGRYVCPGLIEPHSHAYLGYNPASLAGAVLPGGTTTIACDDLFFALAGGPETSRAVMDACAGLPVRFLWYVRPEPASPLDGAPERFGRERLERVLDHPLAVGIGEAPAWARFLSGKGSSYGEAIEEAEARGAVVDGHTTGARGSRLAALAASGLRSCHEATNAEEALERLRLGLWTPLRHSSVRPDLPALLPLLTDKDADSCRILLTTDGPSPDAIAERGFIDGALRLLVGAGVPPVRAIQLATINAATYLKLDDHLGGIAPGRLADILLLEDLVSFEPTLVISGGKIRARDGKLVESEPALDWRSLGLETGFSGGGWISSSDLYDARLSDDAPVVEFVSDVITRVGETPELTSSAPLPEGYLHAAHVDRGGGWISRSLVTGFARDLDGLATTATSSGHLLVLGRDPGAMSLAAHRVRELGGGVAVAGPGGVAWEAALPLAGIMSDGGFSDAVRFAAELKSRLYDAGCTLTDPLYSLLFLTADFLPGPRLTNLGVLDVASGELLSKAGSVGEGSENK